MAITTPQKALNLDPASQDNFINFFNSLPDKPSTTIRIFCRDDYYTLHDDDAEFAAKEVFNSLSAIKLMGKKETLKYVVLSTGNFENFLRNLLLVKQYRVEVYTKNGRSNNWTLEYKGSPGNLSQFDNILFKNEDIVVHTCLMSLKLVLKDSIRTLGVCVINESTMVFSLYEFIDNDIFTELEALIVQISPKECLIPKIENKDMERINLVLERNNVCVTKLPQNNFTKTANLQQDLDRLLYFRKSQQRNSMMLPEMKNDIAVCCINPLIQYLALMTIETNFNQFKINNLDLKCFVHLDSAAVSALNISTKPGVVASPQNSVLGLLNCCRTPQGRRLLNQWIKQPLRDLNLLNERLDIVEAFYNNIEVRNELYSEYLRGLVDLQMIVKKIMHKKAKLQDCYKVYQTVDRLPLVLKQLSREYNRSVQLALVDPLKDLIVDMKKYQEMIESVLDFDAVNNYEYLIKSSFDDNLKELFDERTKLEEKMNRELSKVYNDLELDSGKVKLENTVQFGFCFRVTLKDEPILRRTKKYDILDALKSGIRFTNEKLKILNENYKENCQAYKEQQKTVVDEVMNIAAGYTGTIINLNNLLAKIDVLVAFAHVASSAVRSYVRPKLHEMGTGILHLKQVRHPCVETKDNISYVANDCYFKQEQCHFQLLTGPNMGGKSTFIRSVGVTVLLAHIGSFVPCDHAEISVCDAILARIGADDDETRGLSTFMVEMVETARIIRSATENSLVLIDELGRGTSTFEGVGIAWGIANYLIQKKPFTLFATHFHELTHLADEIEYVKNRHVAAHVEDGSFTLLYEIRDDACDKSYGIHLSQMIGIPDRVINDAVNIHVELDPSTTMNKNIAPTEKRKLIKDAIKFIKSLNKLQGLKQNGDIPNSEIIQQLIAAQQESKTHHNPYIQSLSNFNVEQYAKEFKNSFRNKHPEIKNVNHMTNIEKMEVEAIQNEINNLNADNFMDEF